MSDNLNLKDKGRQATATANLRRYISSRILGASVLILPLAACSTPRGVESGAELKQVPVGQLEQGNQTIAGFHFVAQMPGEDNGKIFGNRRGWATELIYTKSDYGFGDVGTAKARGFRVIARVDYAPGINIPNAGDGGAMTDYLDGIDKAFQNGAEVVVLGNETNLKIECQSNVCEPDNYANVYQKVKERFHDRNIVVGGVSPDSNPDNVITIGGQLMFGGKWLRETTAKIKAKTGSCPDGYSVHAYGGIDTNNRDNTPAEAACIQFRHFRGQLVEQIEAIKAAGCGDRNQYLTEWKSQPYDHLQDYNLDSAAEFSLQVLYYLATGQPQVKAATWFVLATKDGQNWGSPALGFEPRVDSDRYPQRTEAQLAALRSEFRQKANNVYWTMSRFGKGEITSMPRICQ